MCFEPGDFDLEGSDDSEELRQKLGRIGREFVRRGASHQQLSRLVRHYYVTRASDPRVQWLALLPAPEEFKTDLAHLHLVVPQRGVHGATPWFGINIEFQGPRRTLLSKLREGAPSRQELLRRLRGVQGAFVSILQKSVLAADPRRYTWGGEQWPGWDEPRADALDDGDLLGLVRILESPPLDDPRPGWVVEPAVVIGWDVQPEELVRLGSEVVDDLFRRAGSLGPALSWLVER